MIELHWDRDRYPEESAALEGLPPIGEALILGSDFSNASRTVASIIESRRRGHIVAIYPMLVDPLESILEQVGAAIARQTHDGERFLQIAALRENRLNVNEKPLADSATYPREALYAGILCVKLSDLILTFTIAERDRWSALVAKPLLRHTLLPVPHIHAQCTAQSGVAVYAPGMNEAQLALVALALQERRIGAEFVQKAQTHIGAATVIVPSWWRPARVASLAEAGYKMVAPAAGAPDERSICATYRPSDPFTLGAAVDAAQTCAQPGLISNISPDDAAFAIRSTGSARARGPRVSIVVRTFDRPELLARALRSIAAQTYAEVEIVLVNNGGRDIEALSRAACPGRALTYVALPRAVHISAASNAGARAAAGSYIGYLDDDDLLYPDHVARAVEALEGSGADIAYTNCLAEYAKISGGRKELIGFQIFRESEFYLKELYVDNIAPIHSIVHRADLFERFGYFDESLAVTDDWEMWLRAASLGARFIHIDRVTCEYSWRHDPDRGNMTLTHQRQFAQSYETITTRYAADVDSIPGIAAQQQQIKTAQKQRAEQLLQMGPRLAELTIAAMAQNAVSTCDPPADSFA